MTRLERIEYMERILDDAAEAVRRLSEAIERYRELKPRMAELEEYYSLPLWMQDYEDDSAGKLPDGLKRGVLSEDAVYDLLRMQNELDGMLKE